MGCGPRCKPGGTTHSKGETVINLLCRNICLVDNNRNNYVDNIVDNMKEQVSASC